MGPHLLDHCCKGPNILHEGFLHCRLLLKVTVFTLWRALILEICRHSANFWTGHHPAMQCPRILCQANSSPRSFDECIVLFMALVSGQLPQMRTCDLFYAQQTSQHGIPPGLLNVCHREPSCHEHELRATWSSECGPEQTSRVGAVWGFPCKAESCLPAVEGLMYMSMRTSSDKVFSQ